MDLNVRPVAEPSPETTPASMNSTLTNSTKTGATDRPFLIGTHSLNSRLILGTGKYGSFELMQQCHDASGTECITVAVRREKLNDGDARNILDFIDPDRYTLLPNTAGCYDATTAVRCARMGRAILEALGNPGADWVKLEVLGDSRTLLPDPFETLAATESLTKDGFQVLCYTNDDPVTARRLKDAGAVAVMPAGSPIGSGLGVVNRNSLLLLRDELKRDDPNYPVLIDAGVGTASDAAIAMELGFDGVLLNSAVSDAERPITMAAAMRAGVEAGRLAFLAGRMQKSVYGSASSPEIGVISRKSTLKEPENSV